MRDAYLNHRRCLRCDQVLKRQDDQERGACATCFQQIAVDIQPKVRYTENRPIVAQQGLKEQQTMSMTPAGLNFGGDAQQPKYGRQRWQEQVAKTEGDAIYFHILEMQHVQGLSEIVSQLPATYYRHWVPLQALGQKGEGNIPIYCLATPRAPDVAGNWMLTVDGAAECASVILPSGQGLHTYGEPEPVVALAVYVHEHTSMAVNEPRMLLLKRTPGAKGPWETMKRLFAQRSSQGGTAENMVWTLQRAGQFFDLDCVVVRPGEPWAARFPFGDDQRRIIAANATEFCKYFLPPHTKDQIIEDLKLDPKTQSAAPLYQGGTAGPGAPSTAVQEV